MIFMKIHIHKEYFTIYIEKAINWYRDYKVIKTVDYLFISCIIQTRALWYEKAWFWSKRNLGLIPYSTI